MLRQYDCTHHAFLPLSDTHLCLFDVPDEIDSDQFFSALSLTHERIYRHGDRVCVKEEHKADIPAVIKSALAILKGLHKDVHLALLTRLQPKYSAYTCTEFAPEISERLKLRELEQIWQAGPVAFSIVERYLPSSAYYNAACATIELPTFLQSHAITAKPSLEQKTAREQLQKMRCDLPRLFLVQGVDFPCTASPLKRKKQTLH